MTRAPDPRQLRFRLACLPIVLLSMGVAGCGHRPPVLEVSTHEMDFGSQRNDLPFYVKNGGRAGLLDAGVRPLEYEISADRPWLTIDPPSGTCGEGRQNTHIVQVDRAELPVGGDVATIRVASNDGASSILVRADDGSVVCLTPPAAACAPQPADSAANANENSDLKWGCGDSACDGLVATYDVYFGTRAIPGQAEFLGNTAGKAWALPIQARNTTYYWQIVAKDANGSTPGPIWSFKTRR